MRKLFTILLSLLVAFFILGYAAVNFKLLDSQIYFLIATISGGAASVVGLFGLLRRPITPNDLQALEVSTLKKISEIAQQLEAVQSKRVETEAELIQLAAQKDQMQFLVRKASLSLFLHDQEEKQESRILEIIHSNKELSTLLMEHDQLTEKIRALDEEINTDKNVTILKDILRTARSNNSEMDVISYIGISYINLLRRLLGFK